MCHIKAICFANSEAYTNEVMEEWQKRQAKKAELDHKRACEERDREVRSRLRAIGYEDDELIGPDDDSIYYCVQLAYQPKPLTERSERCSFRPM